jgi:outer membrane autotransporter protein
MRKSARGLYGLFRIAARTVIPALLMALLASEAQAQCSPASGNNVTANCAGTTTNQGNGAPGTSAATSGYGAGTETGITVNVDANATVTGTDNGIFIAAGTVTNNSGANVTGGTDGVLANTGSVIVTNSGGISGTTTAGVAAAIDATVTNNVGASITGGQFGIVASGGAANVVNSGSIAGTTQIGVAGFTSATVTNNVGGSITGLVSGIGAGGGPVIVVNSGSIVGTNSNGIIANTDATVTNNSGGSITGGADGILASNGAANVVNSGIIAGTGTDGIQANTNATVTNNAGGSIRGGLFGIIANGGSVNVVNSGSIAGAADFGIQANANAIVTNNSGGSITGAVFGIHASGGGSSVFNAGAISGGTAAIEFSGAGNILTLGPGSVITGNVIGGGADTFQLGGSGAATFDVSQIGAAAQYQGFSAFNKVSDSTWTLTGSNAPLAWTVQQGTLNVSGTIGATTVNGGALMGSGVVGATRINAGGIFAPGNGAAGSSITVAGALTLQSGAQYQVQINRATSSFANVTGSAALAGNVSAGFATGVSLTKKYTILTAAGGLGGTTFDSVTNPANFTASLSYDANDAFLNLVATLGNSLGSKGLNQNQLNVANAINRSFNRGAALPPSFVNLFGLSSGNLGSALTQLSGEAANGERQSAFQFGNSFLSLMLDPYAPNRGAGLGGDDGFGAALGYAGEEKTPSAIGSAYSALAKAPAAVSPSLPHWNLWGEAFGGGAQMSGNDAVGSHNTAIGIGGFAAGADYHVSPESMLGFALAGGAAAWSNSGLGDGRSDVFQAGLYGSQQFGRAYVSAAAAFGDYSIKTNRNVGLSGGDEYNASFNAQSYSGRLESGYHIALSALTLTPYAALQVQDFEAPAYGETAAHGVKTFALNYVSQNATDTRFELGAWADKTFAMPDGNAVKLFGRLAWAHDWQNNSAIEASFIGLPTAAFAVNGARPAPNQALVTGGVEWRLAKDWTLTAKLDGEFGQGSQTYSATGRLSYAW